MEKSPEAYRTIREVADAMDLPQHVLRFWETRFPQIRPLKRAGGRRYYRPDDIERLRVIRRLLYDEGYTIKGVQKLFKEQGVQALSGGAAFHSGPPAELANAAAPPAGPARWRGDKRAQVQACGRRCRGAARSAGRNRGRRTDPRASALAGLVTRGTPPAPHCVARRRSL